jgi:hypothetical protein
MELGTLLDSVDEGQLCRVDQVHELITVLVGTNATGDDIIDLRRLFAAIDEPPQELAALLERLIAIEGDEFCELLAALIELRELTVLLQFH